MRLETWQDWVAWAGLVLPLMALAFSALRFVLDQHEKQRRAKFDRVFELLARFNNAALNEPLFTQLAAVFELRNFPRYLPLLKEIQLYQNEKVAELDDVSSDPIRSAKRDIVQQELKRTIEHLGRRKFFPFSG